MKNQATVSRRSFIKHSAIAGTGILVAKQSLAQHIFANTNPTHNNLEVFLFSKHLQFLDYRGMSEAAKEMGFDGVDLTVRPKGHVDIANVEEQLPIATETMKSFDLATKMISTNVSNASDPAHIKVLETASKLGYDFYRTAWFRYSKDKNILATLEHAKQQLARLAELNEKLNISGSYHNHSGHFFGGGIWDLYQAIEKLSPDQMGSQYDIMHATVEGGKNWEVGFQLIKSHINTTVVKDFVWAKIDGKWVPKFVPLGEGMVDIKRFFSLLKTHKINVPLSIHVEYDIGGAEHGKTPTIKHKEVFKRIKKDLDYVRKIWEEIE